MDDKNTTIVISIIWGLGLACFFKFLFLNGESVIIKVPDIQKTKKD